VPTFVQAFVHLQDVLQVELHERARSCDERRAAARVTSVRTPDRVAAVGDPDRSGTAGPPVADTVELLTVALAAGPSKRPQAA
jgi:hypothetical protein